MKKELFGVFGDRATFERFRSPREFDRVAEGERVTVGIRDVALGIPGRSEVESTEDGTAVVWGEAYVPGEEGGNAAAHLLSAESDAASAFDDLNGSYLAVLDDGDGARVATDPLRTWECYYTDDPGVRVFGTDPVAVAETMSEYTIADEPVAEFMHLGVVLADRTALTELHRVPFDSYLTGDDAVELERFVYEHRSFDYAGELADRLERAIARRSNLPGTKGLLLSGGYDSRTVLAVNDDVDVCYTVGREGSDEAAVAERIAAQYGSEHVRLNLDSRYLNTSPETIRYAEGIKESVHIHHAGYDDRMDVDTMYHGAFGDTLTRGHFLPMNATEVFDLKCPPYRLDKDPDIPEHFAEKFGYFPAWQHAAERAPDRGDPSEAFIRRRFNDLCDRWSHRYDSTADGMALIGIQNQPTLPFRYHLADNYIESFLFADAEIVDWHLHTPPEYRNTATFLSAIKQIDDDVLRHRPPDRPYDSFTLNQIDVFLRKKLPMVAAYDGPWPHRGALYDEENLDRKLLPGYDELHDLPWRVKLRINDLTSWLEMGTGDVSVTPDELLEPSVEKTEEDDHRGTELRH